jgi:4-carboxymuconolactone decarboxylase
MSNEKRGARINLPKPEDMSPAQREVHDEVVRGPRGAVVGPLRAALLNAELASRWQKLGEILRYDTSLPKRISELAIVVTARRWNSDLEWQIHAEAALKAGVPVDIIAQINRCNAPEFANHADEVAYNFTCELQTHGKISDATYAQALGEWDELGVVELTAVIGYYTMVSMTLNAHHIPCPPSNVEELIDTKTNTLTDLGIVPTKATSALG